MSRKFSEEVREIVHRRAGFLCEYCHTNERWQYVRFTIDHIFPNEDDSIENLALACFHCNHRKSNKTSVRDEKTEKEIPLFNPRTDLWKDHFAWSNGGITIIAKTETGKITIDLLELNRERILQIRAADVAVNRHPPSADSG